MERPFVYVNMAMTADGKITSAAREYPKFTAPHDRKTMDRLRAEADAVLVGAGTLRADDPPLDVRSEEMRRLRAALGKPAGLLTVLVTASAAVDPEARFFTAAGAAGRIVATVEDAPPERLERLRARAEVWTLGRGAVDLRALCRRLKEHGVERLLVEGGGELNWGFVRDDLVDEIYVTVAPALLGGRTAPTLLEGEGFSMREQRRLRLVSLESVDDEIYTRWAVVHAPREP
jgi:2,5-diamino-6-(ribosylamino)-4(3H)-pyrimidinone 5'-phosphate reductase